MISLSDPRFETEEIDAVRTVLEDGMVADGPEVRRFETEFADYCGADHAVGTANGTAALHAALEALDIGEGDTVVTTPLSFVASANAIRLAGATPVFADIDPLTYNLDPSAAERAVREHDADAILVVHLYGLPADMHAFQDIAADEDVDLIEDCAQAHGATYRGQSVGTFGDAAAFSFYPTKNMTTGEGGMILTDDNRVAERVASYINHGRTGDDAYAHTRVGHNYRMTSIAAAIGRVQLERLPEWVKRRRQNARRLTAALDDVVGIDAPVEPDGTNHAYHQYTVRAEDREELKEHLADEGVDSGVYYPTPIHELGAYEGFDAETPAAETAADEVLSLPVHPGLSEADLDRIVEALGTPRNRTPL
ncbi:DegT/DnrJ/EryC1/StrS family aminotransferase [Natronomonas halophila]|uniref:DegT/DnrJ/EryC1/StrS family aminotransferase n=1 Tax=Natronomonas halophila TaxID=2747817 RepID=UPI0015B68A42|nr:DegT/DnrJ/EryC1/StrS family aminotransferase [Natronomonas halophila]QLD87477.1 DegT/DnrJ/EryC1/StrS family aminotransferase [Natronomonas halophila]